MKVARSPCGGNFTALVGKRASQRMNQATLTVGLSPSSSSSRRTVFHHARSARMVLSAAPLAFVLPSFKWRSRTICRPALPLSRRSGASLATQMKDPEQKKRLEKVAEAWHRLARARLDHLRKGWGEPSKIP